MTPDTESAGDSWLLIVDTSLTGVAMALRRIDDAPEKLAWHEAHHDTAGSVSAISGLLQRGLNTVGASVDGVRSIAVSVGPGSFTGIKVGLAFVYGLRAGRTTPLMMAGVAAIEAAAARLSAESGGKPCGVLLPATRTHGYVAISGGRASLLDASDAAAVGQLLGHVESGTRLVVAGAWPVALASFQGLGGALEALAPSEVSRAAIYGMSDKAARLWPQEYSESLPAPQYMRLSTAEERLAAAQAART